MGSSRKGSGPFKRIRTRAVLTRDAGPKRHEDAPTPRGPNGGFPAAPSRGRGGQRGAGAHLGRARCSPGATWPAPASRRSEPTYPVARRGRKGRALRRSSLKGAWAGRHQPKSCRKVPPGLAPAPPGSPGGPRAPPAGGPGLPRLGSPTLHGPGSHFAPASESEESAPNCRWL